MLRTSDYIIYVDLPGDREEMLLAHGYTAACDKVDRTVVDYLRSLETRRPPRPLYGKWSQLTEVSGTVPRPSEGTIGLLRKRGYLTHLSPAEEEKLFVSIADKIHAHRLRMPPTFVIMPTYDCNLRCPYCFQDGLRAEGRKPLRTVDLATVDRILKAMEEIESEHELGADGEVPRRITLFGGEPLMKNAKPVVRRLISKAGESRKVILSAVTNGTQLHHFRDCLGAEGISRLQITLDGPPSEHDLRRIDARGRGSFERIAQNIDLALDLGVQVAVRINVDRPNASLLPELAAEIERRGWTGRAGFVAYVAPIRPENDKTFAESTLSSWELDRIVSSLRGSDPLMRSITTPGDLVRRGVRNVLGGRQMLLSILKSSFCGAHSAMYIFDAFGDIYACWEKTGDRSIRIGRVRDDGKGMVETELARLWRSRTVTTNPACRKCRFALYCGGGCAALATSKRNVFFSNYCDGFSSTFRTALAEGYLEHRGGVEEGPTTRLTCDL